MLWKLWRKQSYMFKPSTLFSVGSLRQLNYLYSANTIHNFSWSSLSCYLWLCIFHLFLTSVKC